MTELLIGSHVGVSGDKMLLGAVEETLSYGANTFMFYTGAPQNTLRKEISLFRLEEAFKLMKESGIEAKNVLVHAPYIINLGNSVKSDTFELAVRFLKVELKRVETLGFKMLVVHPGAHVGAGVDLGIQSIVSGINEALQDNDSDVLLLLETMSGKGSEVGTSLQEMKAIYDGIEKKYRIGFCLDTCHLSDSGLDLSTMFDAYLAQFIDLFGIDKLKAIHINDSKNIIGARKDRHENIGFGNIGFETLCKIVHHPLLLAIPKILETPYIGDFAPYKKEIEMLKNKKFDSLMKLKLETKI